MFKQLKGSSSTASAGASSNHHHYAAATTSSSSSSPSRSPSPSSSAKNVSALHLLQQQRKQTRPNSSSFAVTATSFKGKARTEDSSINSNNNNNNNNNNSKKVPITARKKTKVKAIVPVTEEEKGDRTTQEEEVCEADETKDAHSTDSSMEHSDQAAEAATDNVAAVGDDSIVADEQESQQQQQNVVVCVRVRSVADTSDTKVWTMDQAKNRILPTDQHPTMLKRNTTASASGGDSSAATSGDALYDFAFDSLVTPAQTAEDMFTQRISPVVRAVTKGYNGTVFAYGQTGSGKTYTMSGDAAEKGVIPKAVDQIFSDVERTPMREFLLRVSYLEIYNETLNDLLAALPSSSSKQQQDPGSVDGRPSSPTKGGSSHMVSGSSSSSSSSLRIFDAGGRVQIQGLREEIVTTSKQVLDLLERGQKARHQAATDWNERSSRSHCVFMLTVESREKGESGENKSCAVRLSQLNLIDLAGSERAASEKERRKEGAFINKSLLTLGTVIAKLSEQCATGREEAHIPYRDSKLTRLLQTSLSGNARVAVVCTLSPLKEHAIESLSTLRFGQRCKMVMTRAKQGSVMDDKALIARYKRELEKLRAQLEAGAVSSSSSNTAIKAVIDDPALKSLQDEKAKAEEDVRAMNQQRAALRGQIEHLTRLILTGKDVEATSKQQGEVQGVVDDDEDDEIDRVRKMRAARRSDLGTSSPSKRTIKRFDSPNVLTPKRPNGNQENAFTPSMKPFAMESELAQLRKNLNKALSAKQASEDARRKEVQLWQAKVVELEEANKEQEEELDEAEEAFKKLQTERDTMRAKVDEEREANRLLKLVAKSRSNNNITDEQRRVILADSEAQIDKLKEELQQQMEQRRGECTALEDQVKTLQDELSQKTLQDTSPSNSDAETDKKRIAELERQLEEAAGMNALSTAEKEEGDVVTSLREQLQQTREEQERLKQELRQSNLDRGQEDAERDFVELVKGKEEAAAADVRAVREELNKMKERLEKQECENAEIKLANEELKKKANAKPLPVPSLTSSPVPISGNSDSKTSVLERQLRRMEGRCKLLEIQVDTHKREAMAAAFSSNPSPPMSSASSSSASEIADLRQEGEAQRSRIAGLERQLDEAKRIVAQHEADESTSTLKPGPFRKSFASRLSRGGSMREYKRYDASQSGDLAGTGNSDELERALKAEREEVERLNEVITSQRGLMSDLESSVAAWKKRLRLQQDIIMKLVESGGNASPSLLAQTHSIATAAETPATATRSAFAKPTAASAGSMALQRASSTASTASTSSSTSSPYYGAHIYNRPPAHLGGAAHGLGLGSTSPTKGSGWLATMPGHRPDYATSAGMSLTSSSLPAAPQSPGKQHGRKTIEHEIASLRQSPRVESTKTRLLEPNTSLSGAYTRSPAARGPLPMLPGSPPKSNGQTKDWYI